MKKTVIILGIFFSFFIFSEDLSERMSYYEQAEEYFSIENYEKAEEYYNLAVENNESVDVRI